MARDETEMSLVQRIRQADRPVVLLRGPAASGKTTAALAFYDDFRTADGASGALLLVPNAAAESRLRRRRLRESPGGVIVSPGVMTFSALAGRVLTAAGAPGRSLPPFHRHLLLRRIVADLQDAGRLGPLAAVADTPGLVEALDRAIAELKRAAIDPDHLTRVLGRPSGKQRDLLSVYLAYQGHLQESDAFDVEGRMWVARDCLQAALQRGRPPVGLEGMEAVVVDGFTDFTPTQLEMLALLARGVRRVLVTLCCGDDGRRRMWRWPRRTLDGLRDAFGDDLEEISTEGGGGLSEGLFDLDADPRDPPENLHVIAASNIDAEVSAVARRVKRLLLDGAPAGSILITARSMDTYRGVIERIFARGAIPVAAAARPLTDCPIVRFALDAAAMAGEYDSKTVLRVLKSSYFRAAALGEFDAFTVATAEMIIRGGNVLGGRQAYADAAERLLARIAADGGAGDETDDEAPPPLSIGPIEAAAETVVAAADMLERLFDLVEADAGGLVRLIDGLDLSAAACDHDDPALIARDLRALSAFSAAAAAVADVPHRPVTLPHLREALSHVACPPQRSESLVDCLDVLDARAVRYDHVFCLGLEEGTFPRHVTEGSLLGESDRRAWSDQGLALHSRTDLAAREMFLFYLAVTRADAQLTLSYRESEVSGAGAGASGAAGSFLLSLLGPIGGLEGADVERIPPGRFVAPVEQMACPHGALSAAVAGLFRRDLGDTARALGWCATHMPDGIRRVAAGLWARHRRWTPGECDAFDGRLSEKRLIDALARRYPARVVFSASRLNTYGQCPWQYFAKYVLKLAPLPQPQRRLEPAARGLFVHNVLCRMMTDLGRRTGRPVRLTGEDESVLLSALDRAVADESAAVERRARPYPVLWEIQRQQMHDAVGRYVLACRQDDEIQPQCLHFELGFGTPEDAELASDPASTPEPIHLHTPAGDIRVCGKIDRIDRVRFGGREALLVVDYKTSRPRSKAQITSGRSVQIPIYTAAVEEIFNEKCLGGAFHHIPAQGGTSRQFFAAIDFKRNQYVGDEGFARQQEQVIEKIGGFVAGMRSGHFDLLPTHDCPGYCPFRQICHYSPARGEIKGAGE